MRVPTTYNAINLYYDIDACNDCFYGAVAYQHMANGIGSNLLRDVGFFSGDDNATLGGHARTYIISVVGSPERIATIRSKLSATVPMTRITTGLQVVNQEPLVFNGVIDLHGGIHAAHEGCMLEFIEWEA